MDFEDEGEELGDEFFLDEDLMTDNLLSNDDEFISRDSIKSKDSFKKNKISFESNDIEEDLMNDFMDDDLFDDLDGFSSFLRKKKKAQNKKNK